MAQALEGVNSGYCRPNLIQSVTKHHQVHYWEWDKNSRGLVDTVEEKVPQDCLCCCQIIVTLCELTPQRCLMSRLWAAAGQQATVELKRIHVMWMKSSSSSIDCLHVSEPCDQYQDRHTLTSVSLRRDSLSHKNITALFNYNKATVCVVLSIYTQVLDIQT